jgi:hypothetical protein
MGNLTPGAKYIYENDGEKIYAREEGSSERTIIGETNTGTRLRETQLWKDILEAAKTNTALQLALDRAKVIYYLSKDHGT